MGQPPDSVSQPHHYTICWTPEHVRTVFTTASRQKACDRLLQTHRPFRHIRVDVCKAGHAGQTFVTEEAVRTIIQAGPLDADNRLFLVVGEAGSGKSELCWANGG